MNAEGHHQASVRLFRILHGLTRSDAVAAELIDLVSSSGPDRAAPFAMAADAYLASAEGVNRWGFTLNDRFHRDFEALMRGVAGTAGLGQGLQERLEVVRGALTGEHRVTLGVGFDRPGQPPRLKLYLQEDAWGAGIGRVADIARALVLVGVDTPVPEWVDPQRQVDVVALEWVANGGGRAKLYFGGNTPALAADGGPAELQALADTMARICPHPGYYYATVRLYPRQPPQTAINKIYALAAMDHGRDAQATLAALRDVAALFRHAGRLDALKTLLAALRRESRILVIPTATALEDAGRSADCYVAAFPAGGT